MRKLAFAALAVFAAACGESALTPEEIRDALPKKESIRIGTPDDASAAAAGRQDALTAQAALATTSEFAATTYWTAVTVNTAVFWTLLNLEVITLFQPTACTEDACTWGPHLGEDGLNRWQLVVSREGDGYAYALSGQPVAHPEVGFLPLVAGVAHRGQDRWHGRGTFTVDFEAAADLDHEIGWTQEDYGILEVTYDNRNDLQVDCVFLGAQSDDPADPVFMDAAYAFDASAGGGTLEIAFRTLELEPWTLSLRSRWNETGAGRGDARVTFDGGSYQKSECWGATGGELLFDTEPDPDYGEETFCAFLDAEYATLAPPSAP
jgi:hypothetical protein